MPRTAITAQTPKGPYPGTVSANDLDITWTAGDAVNGNSVVLSGPMLLLFRNDNVGAQTFTVSSTQDPYKRTGDVSAYSLGASEYAAFLVKPEGWIQSDGRLYIDVGSADIKIAVLKLPG